MYPGFCRDREGKTVAGGKKRKESLSKFGAGCVVDTHCSMKVGQREQRSDLRSPLSNLRAVTVLAGKRAFEMGKKSLWAASKVVCQCKRSICLSIMLKRKYGSVGIEKSCKHARHSIFHSVCPISNIRKAQHKNTVSTSIPLF